MQRSDPELVSAYIKEGDDQAFGELVDRHQEQVYGYLMGMVRDVDVANDLFQETFLKAIQAMRSERGSYSAQGKWLPWIMRIARNTALDHIRRKQRRKTTPESHEEDYFNLDQLPRDSEPGAWEQLARAEQNDYLYRCIERLPEEQREVLLMRHDSELTFREIAELTDCSINTALGRMRYALINLRKMMNDSNLKELHRFDYSS